MKLCGWFPWQLAWSRRRDEGLARGATQPLWACLSAPGSPSPPVPAWVSGIWRKVGSGEAVQGRAGLLQM